MNDSLKLFVEKQQDFLKFLKTRFNLFHESNVFFRDLHYGVMAFLRMNELPDPYSRSEDLARRIIASYEDSNIFLRIDERTWMLNYLPFKKPAVKAVPTAKPAAKPTATPSQATPRTSQQNAAPNPVEVGGGVNA